MDVDGLVVHDGDLAAALGRLVRNQAGDWFEPELPLAEPGGRPRRVRPVSPFAIRIAGADFDDLAGHFEDDGMVEGFARVTGIWSGDQLQVQRQGVPKGIAIFPPLWIIPPCPAPVGGWPRHRDNLRVSLDDLLDTGAAVAVTVFRPGPDQEVLVVAATDPDTVEARLRPQLGQRFCIVASRWTTEELDAVRAHLHARQRAWNLFQLGQSTGEDGQARIVAKLTRVLPEIAVWATSLPAGIMSLDPWLRPVHPRPSDP